MQILHYKHITLFKYVVLIFLLIIIIPFSDSLHSREIIPWNISRLPELYLEYNFGFWLTSKAAVGKFTVKKTGDNRYVVTLTGETQGAIAFFTNYRKDVMISEMIFDKKSRRFFPVKFVKKIIIGENYKESVYLFDYKNMRIVKKRKKIKIVKQNNDPEEDFMNNLEDKSFFPKKIIKISTDYIPLKHRKIDDYLTASMNFFIGAYGFPPNVNKIKIRLFPEKSRKKRNRVITVLFKQGEKKGLIEMEVNLNVDFISDKIKKAFVFIGGNMIPEHVLIPTGTILGTLNAERIHNIGEKK